MRIRWPTRWRELPDDGTPATGRRLAAGEALMRSGRVSAFRAGPGQVTASVQGDRATPYRVELRVPLLADEEWQHVVETVAAESRYRACLLAGQEPDGLESVLIGRGIRLFVLPEAVDCECDDSRDFCAHAAAVWHAAGAQIDDDPFLLLTVRGRGQQRLLGEVAAARSSGEAPLTGVDVDTLAGRPWDRPAAPLERLFLPAVARPATPAPLLRALGDPPGWAGASDAVQLLGPLVTAGANWLQERAPHRGSQPPSAG